MTNGLIAKATSFGRFKQAANLSFTNSRGACWSPTLNLFIVSNVTNVYTSPDGVTWTVRSGAAGNGSVAWAPEIKTAFATGSANILYSSTDASTWIQIPLNSSNSILCWASGLGLLCGHHWSTSIPWVYDSQTGVTNGVYSGFRPNNMCWSPKLNVLIGVSSTGAGTSQDGLTWTSRVASGNWMDVCWSPELGMACAVGEAGKVGTTTDGMNWTVSTIGTTLYNGVTWNPDLGIFLAIGKSGASINILVSSDGITFTAYVAHTYFGPNKSLGYAGGLTWSSSLGIFLFSTYLAANETYIMSSTSVSEMTGGSWYWRNKLSADALIVNVNNTVPVTVAPTKWST